MTNASSTPESLAQGAAVEEMMIRAAQCGPTRFVRLEEIMADFVGALGAVLSEFSGASIAADIEAIDYETVAAVRSRIGQSGTRILAETPEWNGSILLWLENPVLTTILSTLMGVKTESGSGDSRTFTRLENRIIRKIGTEILAAFSLAARGFRELRFCVTALEEDPEESEAWQDDADCIVLSVTLAHGELTAKMLLAVPFRILEPDWEILAKPVAASTAPPMGGWRDEITNVLTHAGVELVAVLKDGTVSLSEALQWKAGQTLGLEIDPNGPLRVACDDRWLFSAVAGRRKNGAVALRITSDVNIERTSTHVSFD